MTADQRMLLEARLIQLAHQEYRLSDNCIMQGRSVQAKVHNAAAYAYLQAAKLVKSEGL